METVSSTARKEEKKSEPMRNDDTDVDGLELVLLITLFKRTTFNASMAKDTAKVRRVMMGKLHIIFFSLLLLLLRLLLGAEDKLLVSGRFLEGEVVTVTVR